MQLEPLAGALPLLEIQTAGSIQLQDTSIHRPSPTGSAYVVQSHTSDSDATTVGEVSVYKQDRARGWGWARVDDANRPTGENGLTGLSSALDSAGVIHITWFRRTPGSPAVRYATFDTTTDAWDVLEDIDSVEVQDNFLNKSSIDVDSSNSPHVVWSGGATLHVWYSERTGGSWTVPFQVDTSDAGRPASIAVDSSDNIHVLWWRGPNIRYRQNDGSWLPQENAASGNAGANTGYLPLIVEGGEIGTVWYFDPVSTSNWEVRFTKRDTSGTWNTNRVWTQTWQGSIEWSLDLAYVNNLWIAVFTGDLDGTSGKLYYSASITGEDWTSGPIQLDPGGPAYKFGRIQGDTRATPPFTFEGISYLDVIAEENDNPVVNWIPVALPLTSSD